MIDKQFIEADNSAPGAAGNLVGIFETAFQPNTGSLKPLELQQLVSTVRSVAVLLSFAAIPCSNGLHSNFRQ